MVAGGLFISREKLLQQYERPGKEYMLPHALADACSRQGTSLHAALTCRELRMMPSSLSS